MYLLFVPCSSIPPGEATFLTILSYLADLSKSLVIGEMGSSPIAEKRECVYNNAKVMMEKAQGYVCFYTTDSPPLIGMARLQLA